jgi:hypothetical protein
MLGRASVRFRPGSRWSVSLIFVIGAVLVTLAAPAPRAGPHSEPQRPEPYVLRWYDPQNPQPFERRTEVGLLYAPAVLAALVARQPAEAVAPRIAEAIRGGTPIVVMWEFGRTASDAPGPQRPYSVRIMGRRPGETGWIAPLWIQQDAAGLQELDAHIMADIPRPGSGAGIGVMAAFPHDAFAYGRYVSIESTPVGTEFGPNISHARYGVIDQPLLHALAR